MGYQTEFKGRLRFTTPLTAAQVAYIRKFSDTRRMKRDANKASSLPDPVRLAAGIAGVGEEGGYFVGGGGDFGQGHDLSVLDHNKEPKGQPGLWCKWTVNNAGTQLGWSGAEKFYDYVQWLKYLITHFFNVWGVKLNGKIRWQGEELGDIGTIVVEDSKVTVKTTH